MTNHERLVEALNLWVSLTAFDDKRSSGTLRDWDIQHMSKSIKEGLELDNQNITGFLLLGYFANSFFRNTHFTVAETLADPERIRDFMDRAAQLQTIVTDPQMLEDLRHFQLITRQAARQYQADTDEVMALIENDYEMGFLRRDALRSMKNLRVDHFLAGDPEPEHVKPGYNRSVYQFWNINSLLQAVCASPSGVSINLIRTPDNYQSYFVFSIRNGGHVITLSDIPAEAHPLQRYMSRRPEKAFGNRMFQNWFPYHLMDMVYDEEQGQFYFAQKYGEKGIVPINSQAFPLAAMKDLEAHEVIWLTLMFELIVERFWRQPVQPKQLSYTGDMIRVESTLIDRASDIGLPVVQYEGLNLPTLTVHDVAQKQGGESSALGRNGGNHNQWMVDRYQSKIQDVSMNMLGTGNIQAYISSQNTDLPAIVKPNDSRGVSNSIMDRETRYRIHHLDSSAFGSREQLEADRIFIARHNLANEIQRLADQEFKARKDEIQEWFATRVKENVDRLYALLHNKSTWGEFREVAGTKEFTSQSFKAESGFTRYQLSEMMSHEDWKKTHQHYESTLSLHHGWNSKTHTPYCFENGTTSTYQLVVTPQCKEDIAFLTNTPVSELPDILQHWHVRTYSSGNHLLDRVDPMSWVLDNPWEKQGFFNVKLALSIRGLKQVLKTAKHPEDFGYLSQSGYVYRSALKVPGLDVDAEEQAEEDE